MIIAADGTNSIVRKQLAPKLDTSPKLVGIRQYYRGVNLSQNHNHVYFRNGTNGYFWAFPLKDDLWNIGYGTPEHKPKENGNVKDEYQFFINHFPELKKAMANAVPQEKIVGHKLASFSKKAKISGDGFMLAGDAGFLIDPAWGHGIDKAMISGRYAAETAIEAIKSNDFSSSTLRKYDQKVHQRFGSEMRKQYLMVKYFGKYNALLKFIAPFLKMIDKRIS